MAASWLGQRLDLVELAHRLEALLLTSSVDDAGRDDCRSGELLPNRVVGMMYGIPGRLSLVSKGRLVEDFVSTPLRLAISSDGTDYIFLSSYIEEACMCPSRDYYMDSLRASKWTASLEIDPQKSRMIYVAQDASFATTLKAQELQLMFF